MKELKQILCVAGIATALLALSLPSVAQDTVSVKKNEFIIDANLMTRGELRYGGLPNEDDEEESSNRASFILERTRLGMGYKRDFLEVYVQAQHAAVWGQAGGGGFNLRQAWVQLRANNGLFAKIGRQELAYDDERVIGSDDWSMAPFTHDVLKMGWERGSHKIHALLAYNQNAESVNGGSEYRDGDKPYKAMEALWYHFDAPRFPLGMSLLFVNMGMQSKRDEDLKATYQQQMLGTYISYTPERWTAEGSFYYQMGRNEYKAKISAWMVSLKGEYYPTSQWSLNAGYDHLSGDPHYVVPKPGSMGLVRHETINGFSPVYGEHHKFYGAMDFFYVSTYFAGFSPGLQNAYLGAEYKPIQALKLSTTYHYLATSTTFENLGKTLGHELEFSLSYKPLDIITISAGYTFMHGTETMERLKRVSTDRNLHWAWLSLSVSPNFFSFRW